MEYKYVREIHRLNTCIINICTKNYNIKHCSMKYSFIVIHSSEERVYNALL